MSTLSLKCVVRSFLALGFLMLATVEVAAGEPRKAQHNLHVYTSPDATEQNEMCFYRIDQQADQDVLRIAPGGTIRFYTDRGLWVNIDVQDDAQGRQGTQGSRQATLRSARPVAQLTVREAIGASTEHKISINCCLGRSPNSCTDNWIEAQPSGQALGARETRDTDVWVDMTPRAWPQGPHAMDTAGGRPAPSPPPHPMPGGGPMMEIDEES